MRGSARVGFLTFVFLHGHVEEPLGVDGIVVPRHVPFQVQTVALGVGDDVHVLHAQPDLLQIRIVLAIRMRESARRQYACVRWVCSEYQGLLSSGDPAVLVLGELFVDSMGELEPADLLDSVEQQQLPIHRVVGEVVEHALERVVVLRLFRIERPLEFSVSPRSRTLALARDAAGMVWCRIVPYEGSLQILGPVLLGLIVVADDEIHVVDHQPMVGLFQRQLQFPECFCITETQDGGETGAHACTSAERQRGGIVCTSFSPSGEAGGCSLQRERTSLQTAACDRPGPPYGSCTNEIRLLGEKRETTMERTVYLRMPRCRMLMPRLCTASVSLKFSKSPFLFA